MRDCGWRTGLGTCFYNRVVEAERLSRVVGEGWTVLVVGPRNVGKSELVRYALARRMGVRPVVVDARALVVKGGVESALREAGGLDARDLLKVLVEVAAGRLGLGGLVEKVAELYRRSRATPYLVVDEVQYLADVMVLEALAKMVAFYPEYRGVRLVLTSSEGVFMKRGVLARLTGYRVYMLFVDEMPGDDFAALYEEYCRLHGCRVGLGEYERLVGRLPGYLPEVAHLDEDAVREWVDARRAVLEDALYRLLPERLGVGAGEALELAYRLLVEGVEAREPRLVAAAEVLVEANIAYPVGYTRRYKPQLRVYAELLRELRGGG